METTNDYSVAILVVNYNKEKYLVDRSLKSINNQTYSNVKLIFVENGSTKIVYTEDDVKKIITNIPYKYIKVEENHGYPGGMNTALEAVDTDFYMDVDSDDYAEPTLVEKMIDAYNESKCEMIFCKHDKVFLDDNKVEDIISNNRENLTLDSLDIIPSMLDWFHVYKNNFVSEDLATPWAILYKSDKLKDARIDNRYSIGMYCDFDYTLSLIRKVNKVHYISDVLYHLNRGMISASNPGKRSEALANDTFLAINNIYNSLSDLDNDEIKLAYCRFIYSKFFLIGGNCKDYEDFKNKYIELKNTKIFKLFKKYKPEGIKQKIKKSIFIHSPSMFYKICNRK